MLCIIFKMYTSFLKMFSTFICLMYMYIKRTPLMSDRVTHFLFLKNLFFLVVDVSMAYLSICGA